MDIQKKSLFSSHVVYNFLDQNSNHKPFTENLVLIYQWNISYTRHFCALIQMPKIMGMYFTTIYRHIKYKSQQKITFETKSFPSI